MGSRDRDRLQETCQGDDVTSLMRAMVLDAPGRPLRLAGIPVPRPGPDQVLIRVEACAVCRTDLHVVDGELPNPKLPLVPGHVGRVAVLGGGVHEMAIGQRVGVPWLGWTCGRCEYCGSDRENLCPDARFTGYHIDGGYAEYAVADARFAVLLPDPIDSLHAAPLLCAGLIGYRSLRMTGDARRLGLYGFGAAAHFIAQVARWEGREVYAFTRPGDTSGQAFARQLGAAWAGGSGESPLEPLDAAIIFAPVGTLVPAALAAVRPGGTVVCGGIHMSDIPPKVPVKSSVTPYPLEEANQALSDLRQGRLQGAAVLVPAPDSVSSASE
jgi:alcohol dehydrogenase, propanol-preferring